jgi:hypothetical protein
MLYLPLFVFFPLSYRHTDSRLWDVQTTYELQIRVLCDGIPCRQVSDYQRFEGGQCLYLQGQAVQEFGCFLSVNCLHIICN